MAPYQGGTYRHSPEATVAQVVGASGLASRSPRPCTGSSPAARFDAAHATTPRLVAVRGPSRAEYAAGLRADVLLVSQIDRRGGIKICTEQMYVAILAVMCLRKTRNATEHYNLQEGRPADQRESSASRLQAHLRTIDQRS